MALKVLSDKYKQWALQQQANSAMASHRQKHALVSHAAHTYVKSLSHHAVNWYFLIGFFTWFKREASVNGWSFEICI